MKLFSEYSREPALPVSQGPPQPRRSLSQPRRTYGGQVTVDGVSRPNSSRRSSSPALKVDATPTSSRSRSPGDVGPPLPRTGRRQSSMTRLPNEPAVQAARRQNSQSDIGARAAVSAPPAKQQQTSVPPGTPTPDGRRSATPQVSPRMPSRGLPPKLPQAEHPIPSANTPEASVADADKAGMWTKVQSTLRATAAELKFGGFQSTWFRDKAGRQEFQSVLNESSMTPRLLREVCTAAGISEDPAADSASPEPRYAADEQPGGDAATSCLSFRDRLWKAMPSPNVANCLEWCKLVAIESVESLNEQAAESSSKGRPKALCVDVNSGGQVFFGVLAASSSEHQEEVVVIKFCNSRHMLQAEQMAAELSWHLEIPSPESRVLLKAHDTHEWQQLAARAETLCPALHGLLERKQSMLLMQFIRGSNMHREINAWRMEHLTQSTHAIGRLFVLDLLLGNSDRLPVKSLHWRGNPSNVIWSAVESIGSSCRCVPIDATVARRPPKMLVQETDQAADCLLELVLLDRKTAQRLLLELVAFNESAVDAIEADWAPTEPAWQARQARPSISPNQKQQDGCQSTDTKAALPTVSAVKAFHEGIRCALGLASRELGLLEMVADVIQSWLDAFHEDMSAVSKARKPLGKTKQIQDWSRAADKDDDVRDRLSSWQNLLQEKSRALRTAVDDWADRRGVKTVLSFRGFLGESVLNPIADAYELLVRLKQLISRAKVMATASNVTRPCDLSPSPLLVGPVTACCFHLLRKLGVTVVLNCTSMTDLPSPQAALSGEDLKVYRLALEDREDQDLAEHLDEGLRVIDEAVASGGRVFVHCFEGKSRSVSVCLAYMITREHRTLADALSFIKSRRPQIRPNVGFMKQLFALELAVLGSNSMSTEDLPKGKPMLSSAGRRPAEKQTS